MSFTNTRKKYAFVFLLGGLLGTFYLIFSVFTSTSSTAAIGLLFLPLYFLAGAIALAIPCAAVFTSGDILKGDRSTNKIFLALSAWALIVYILSAGIIWKKALAEAKEAGASESKLTAAYNRWLPFGKLSVKIAVAENPAAGPAVLRDLWADQESSLRARILENPKTPPDILQSVAEAEPDYYLQSALARNPALSPVMIASMIKSGTREGVPNRNLLATYVLAEFARREDLPEDLLQILMADAQKRPAYFLVYSLANNGKVSCEATKRFLGKDDPLIEREVNAALQRKNCP
jgi:hypothetical protein